LREKLFLLRAYILTRSVLLSNPFNVLLVTAAIVTPEVLAVLSLARENRMRVCRKLSSRALKNLSENLVTYVTRTLLVPFPQNKRTMTID
jgi:hypothetical protein